MHRTESRQRGPCTARRRERHRAQTRAAGLRIPQRTLRPRPHPRDHQGNARPPHTRRTLGAGAIRLYGSPTGARRRRTRRGLPQGARGGLHLRQRLVGRQRDRGLEHHGREARHGDAGLRTGVSADDLHREHEPQPHLPLERHQLHRERRLRQRQSRHRYGHDDDTQRDAGHRAHGRRTGDGTQKHALVRRSGRLLHEDGCTP